ncbi:MAG: NAD(P)H-dependent glycerol-3-phosphate dehydrogenase [Alphaproteobacteria bacterium]
MSIETVGIVGAGAWGTALALVAGRAGHRTIVSDRDPAIVAAINQYGAGPAHLGESGLPISASEDSGAAAAADILILAVPAQKMREAATELAGAVRTDQPIVVAAKGIELSTGKRLSEVLGETLPSAKIAVLSGPSFAADVAKNLPTAVTVAAPDEVLARDICRALGGPTFRPYAETDIVGVEIGGALKNVMAIAAGIVAGRSLGASAGAALIARGFAEMRRFAEAFGARPETLMGLSGLGDIILTCSSAQSRNFSVGLALGDNRPIPDLLAEGIATAAITQRLADERGIPMPITAAVASVLARAISVDEAIDELMSRPLRAEAD